jgi:ribose transport system substrate-binding protein
VTFFRHRAGLLLPAIFLTFAFSGCHRDTRKRIAVVPKGQAHLFWQSVHAGAVSAGREAGVEIIWDGPPSETDFTGQLQIVDAMITRHVDALCLAPIDKTAMVSVVERAHRENIPVVIFDSPVDSPHFVAQVATDNYQAGVLGAERMGKILGGKGKIAEVAVQPGAASTMAREQGFEDAVKKDFPGIEIVDKRYGWADRAKSLAIAENMLTAHSDLDAMFASNESSTVGASQAIKGRNAKVKLVGFDWSPGLLEDLKAGLIDSLVVQDPFRMGHDAVAVAVQGLKGATPQKIQNLPPRVVTRENLDDADVQRQLHPDLDKYLK